MLGLPVWAGVVVLVVAILAVNVLLWMLVIRPRLRRGLASATRDATMALGGAATLREGTVRSMGLESGGAARLRGTGHLAVTEDEIVFVLVAPRRTLRIARDAVVQVDTTRTHAGRASGRPFLRIRFTDETGVADAVAFDVPRGSLEAWRGALAVG